MTQIGKTAASYLLSQLGAKTGINSVLAELRKQSADVPADFRSILEGSVPSDLLERSNQAHYPSLVVYCEKLSNTQKQKFRLFSGIVRLSIEVRNSADRVETLDHNSLIYTDAVCSVLDSLRGSWDDNLMFNGAYEVSYSGVKSGGKHFVQLTKVTLELDVSI